MKASCSCTVKAKNHCLFSFGGRTLFDETKIYETHHTKALYIALAERIRQWGDKYGEIREKHSRVSLTLQVCIEGENHVFHRFTPCRIFLSDLADEAAVEEKSGYVSFSSAQSRSMSL